MGQELATGHPGVPEANPPDKPVRFRTMQLWGSTPDRQTGPGHGGDTYSLRAPYPRAAPVHMTTFCYYYKNIHSSLEWRQHKRPPTGAEPAVTMPQDCTQRGQVATAQSPK
ncbi:Extracellular Matrix Protein Fras1 [Manis pentadactyla]|nr:Extracellular Matrix Protein Fras1 [Manis pentadactyla]